MAADQVVCRVATDLAAVTATVLLLLLSSIY